MAIYVTNKELYTELVFCIDASLTHTPKLLEMFTKISEKHANKYTYKNKDDRIDVIQGGIIDAYMYWHNFNPKYPNAFAYITQIIKNGQLKTLKQIYPLLRPTHVSLSSSKIYSL